MEIESEIRENSRSLQCRWSELNEKQRGLVIVVGSTLVFIICGLCYLFIVKHDAPLRLVEFSVVGVTASGLNTNATSWPVFRITLQLNPASAYSMESCLTRISATISYSGNILAELPREPYNPLFGGIPCYDLLYRDEFVMQVRGSDRLLTKNLLKSLVNGTEEVKLDVEMEFGAELFPSNRYHVWCKNVPIKKLDVPMPCSVTMKVNLI